MLAGHLAEVRVALWHEFVQLSLVRDNQARDHVSARGLTRLFVITLYLLAW